MNVRKYLIFNVIKFWSSYEPKIAISEDTLLTQVCLEHVVRLTKYLKICPKLIVRSIAVLS